jgi:RHS repeat-associated protein
MNREDKDYYYLPDGLGSVAAIADSAGSVVQEYRYSAFGEIAEQSGGVESAFGFTARERGDASGMWYFRLRYYNSQLGRFLSRDPLGPAADMNTYRYASNNPINALDLLGLKAVPRTRRSSGSGSTRSPVPADPDAPLFDEDVLPQPTPSGPTDPGILPPVETPNLWELPGIQRAKGTCVYPRTGEDVPAGTRVYLWERAGTCGCNGTRVCMFLWTCDYRVLAPRFWNAEPAPRQQLLGCFCVD